MAMSTIIAGATTGPSGNITLATTGTGINIGAVNTSGGTGGAWQYIFVDPNPHNKRRFYHDYC